MDFLVINEEKQKPVGCDYLSADEAVQIITSKNVAYARANKAEAERELQEQVDESNPETFEETVEHATERIVVASPERQRVITNYLLAAIAFILFLNLIFK